MPKLAVLEISTGSFATGFAVKLQVSDDGAACTIALPGQLPPAPEVLHHYESWQMGYRSRGQGFRQLQAVPSSTRQRSNLKVLASELETALNQWLDSSSGFQKIRDQLLKTFSTQEPVRLILQTDQLDLWQLPWELWQLVQDHPHVGVALSKRDYAPVQPIPQTRSTVRILALLGDSTDINIQRDLELLQQHLPPEAEIYAPKLVERSQLNEDLWTQSWDILFFAGHSSSQAGEGKLYLTADTCLTIPELKYALAHAIAHGLQLAIFNSCDGLKLARDLADLQLPATIVMRERIPDQAAQDFLSYFLQAFAQDGRSLQSSVREARQRLQGLEDKYPCVSWLPVISQNPVAPVLEWRSFLPVCPSPDLLTPFPPPPPIPVPRQKQQLKARSVLLISLGVTCLVMGVRFLGKLEPLELLAYDHLLRLRPSEPLDDRILVVEAGETDMDQYGKPLLSDAILAKAIDKLAQLKPRAIGVDIYRPNPVSDGRKQLIQNFSQHKNLVGVCVMSNQGDRGIAPPPELSQSQLLNQIGFSDLFYDESSSMVRRQVFWQTARSASKCATSPYSLSFLLADLYLVAEGYKSDPRTGEIQFHHPKFGTVTFHRLPSRAGGYQQLSQKTNNILLNYRSPFRNGQVANSVALEDILNNRITEAQVKNKVVLLGVTAKLPDEHQTPYGIKRGLWVHTQMVSSILSAVMDNRKLMWLLPQWSDWQWGDTVWVFVWSGMGGLLVWYIPSRLLGAIAGAGLVWGLYEVCSVVLVNGGWMPLVPSAISLVSTMSIVSICIIRQA